MAYYQGDIEGCITNLERLLRLEPKKLRIKEELVPLYRERGNVERAILLLEDIRRAKPDDPDIKGELFCTLCLAGKYKDAASLLPFTKETSEILFYEAMLYRDTGNPGKAIEMLRKSLAAENFRPVGWFMLGELLAASAPAEAETCFRTALRQEPGLAFTLVPLAELLLAQNRYKEAYDYLSQAASAFPNNGNLTQRLGELRNRLSGVLPGGGEDRNRPPERRRISANPPRVKALGKEAEGMVVVRIGLTEAQSSIAVKTGGAYTLRFITGTQLFAGEAREELWVEMQQGKLRIQNRGGTIIISEKPVILAYQDPENTTMVAASATEDRSYRGRLEFRPEPGGITLVNSLNIEEYLYGVIPAEMPAYWPFEALKAQAIAARSYTLAFLGQYQEQGFDLYGSVLSAAYRGAGGEAPATTAAVDATRGMYMKAGGQPLQAYYSANHGGYSEDSRSVWGYDAFMSAVPDKLLPLRTTWLPPDELVRWIRARPASYSSVATLHSSQAYRWEKWVSPEDIRNRIAGEGDIGDVLQVISRGRGISGRINEVEIRGAKGNLQVRGDRIRSRLGGLRSNLFTIRSKLRPDGKPEYFIFQGVGWGHGVGLDQSGAAGMAQAGFKAPQILKHYYPLAEIVRN
ncbi:MAG: SpoIID/LytB domain-containing protein [Treponema sp.]|jgi:SpoIID/LytB domain protein|nr:SpoIID/LytB domain-containing protein [Treponema sp.]